MSMYIPGKVRPGEDCSQLFLKPCSYNLVAYGTQAAVAMNKAGCHLHEWQHPLHGGMACLCSVGHKLKGGHSTKVSRLAVVTYRPLGMQRQPGELPKSVMGGGARSPATSEAQEEQLEEEEQQAD